MIEIKYDGIASSQIILNQILPLGRVLWAALKLLRVRAFSGGGGKLFQDIFLGGVGLQK